MNALAKYTLGPWYPSGNYIRNQPDGAGIRIAWVCGDGPQPEWIPNRNLLAAAPEMAEAMLSILALYKEDPDDLETMDKGIKLMEPVLRKAGLLS